MHARRSAMAVCAHDGTNQGPIRKMLLPFEYAFRNLSRRPVRTALTLFALSVVILLVFIVVAFIRGLEQSLGDSGDPEVVLVYSVNSEDNLENSSIAARTPALLTASLDGALERFGIKHVSPELVLGTRVSSANDPVGLGLLRGVTLNAPLVRRAIRLVEGNWPGPGEVMAGKLVAAKLGCDESSLAVGNPIDFEGRTWRISGRFAAGGTAYEAELWCRLEDFQSATKRQDLSLIAMLLKPQCSAAEVELFCIERTDLELRAIRETEYYASLEQHYQPVRMLAWLVVWLVSAAGVFTGLNMMYGAVAGRVREIATLQTIGYRRRAILLSLVQEGVLLAAASSLVAGTIALILFNGLAVRFTMGAFALRIDSISILTGCGVGLLLGVLGSLPPALKALRTEVASALKAI